MNNHKSMIDSNPAPINTEVKARHDESVKKYPNINLLPAEYVVINVKRSVWGLVRIWFIAIAACVAIIAATVMMGQIAPSGNTLGIAFVGFLVMILAVIGGTIAAGLYKKNTFIVTSERVIMQHQTTPFSIKTQNIEIENIEDCSYTRNGILNTMLDLGTIRLSTVGNEHTYMFHYVERPAEQFKVVNEVVQMVDRDQTPRRTR
ncbi:MAG: PH domain-containing protein [Candidatus Nomurabacteria bacterium]|jgi:hypothetical protein|nr:PH domain-containing protein [Candidatus Nomurabacteria bacterium]